MTGAETCELALALAAAGRTDAGIEQVAAMQHLRHDDGSYWTGYVYPDDAPLAGGADHVDGGSGGARRRRAVRGDAGLRAVPRARRTAPAGHGGRAEPIDGCPGARTRASLTRWPADVSRGGACWSAAQRAQSMQVRAAGRAARRSGAIGRPQVSQIP